MNLFKTTAFKLAVLFAVVFILIAVSALTSMYYYTVGEIAQQTERELLHEIGELEAQYYQEGRTSLVDLIKRRDVYGKHLHHFYALTHSDSSLDVGNLALFDLSDLRDNDTNDVLFQTSDTTIYGQKVRDILRIATSRLEDGSIIIVGQDQQSLVELRESTFSAMLIVVSITTVLSLLSGFFMGQYVLRNISRINEGLSASFNNDFNLLLPVPKEHNEFFTLTEKLNHMLIRIRDLISSIRQVSDNIAHELRSPLTRMRSRLEVTLLQSRTSAEYQEAMEQAIEDCNDLLTTFNALLSIARAESGIDKEGWSTINLYEIADELYELYSVVAEDAGHQLQFTNSGNYFKVSGNRQLLAQALSNILENAIKYTPVPGNIHLDINAEDTMITISLCDNGPGIPVEDRQRVLERFQRLNRDTRSSGSGLGLHLVQAVAKLHHAELSFKENHPGLCVILKFPSNNLT